MTNTAKITKDIDYLSRKSLAKYAFSLFDEKELSMLSLGEVPPSKPASVPRDLSRCTPEELSGIAKDLETYHTKILERLYLLEKIGYLSPNELGDHKTRFIESLSICDVKNNRIALTFGLPNEQSIARACDYRSLKKQLIKIANDQRINREAQAALVGGLSNQNYCSDQTLRFRKRQEELSQQALEQVYVRRHDSAQIITLAEIAKDQERRKFNHLFHIAKNLQVMADEAELTGYFVTFTAPGNYHPNPAKGKRSYDQSELRNAHTYLQERWKLLRARLAKARIPLSISTLFGMRFVEVHKDGCAHWHLLIFTTPDRFDAFQCIADGLFPAHRQWDHIAIDRAKGEATSYLFKYLAKAVDSSKFDDARLTANALDDIRSEQDQASLASAERVTAALRAQRIRQYQCFGVGNAMTKYRLINKIEESVNSFDSACVRSTLTACRMYNDGKKDKATRNLTGFKMLLTEFSNAIEVVKEPSVNRFGESTSRTIGLRFSCGYVYLLPQYEISRTLENLIFESSSDSNFTDNDELDRLERESFLEQILPANDDEFHDNLFKEQRDIVTVIYSDPRRAHRPDQANYPRPSASDLLKIVNQINPKYSYVKYIDKNNIQRALPPLKTEEIIELLSNWQTK
ncbi:replication endonuclease [Pseudomonas aeruginosa]|nr:replication endonuclease [Pseudomonas aeruginosa]